MPENVVEQRSDVWSDWLLHRRHAGDPDYEKRVLDAVQRIADKVLDGANLRPGMVLADIGAGAGLIGFGAIGRIGPALRVIFADISAPLLSHTESLAIQRGVHSQCEFIQCPADRLAGIPDSSVDAITTRAVLAYVADKPTALREFYRVLKPGGRLSIAEPILRDNAYENIELKKLVDCPPPNAANNRFLSLLHRWRATQFPDTPEQMAENPLTNYTERDLFRFVTASGFVEARLEFHIEVLPCATNSWDVFLGASPHPLAPSLGTTLANGFTEDEYHYFEQTIRPIVENNHATSTERNAYITAIKPAVS